MTAQTKTNNLNYLIDPINKVNRLFVLSSEKEDDRCSFSKYYTPKSEIKDFNYGKIFFDVLVKNKEEACEKIVDMSKNNDYTTDNLLYYEYFLNHYKLIAINLSKKKKKKKKKKLMMCLLMK